MRVLVTGGNGLVGKYLQKIMPNAVYVGSKDYDLTSQREAYLLIAQERPDWVIHLAAKVGGIIDNKKLPCTYYEQNILMNTNILMACRELDVRRFTGVLSTCAYPDSIVSHDYVMQDIYPLSEDLLHDGPPSETNFGYGIAKRALATQIEMSNKQYGTEYNYVIPCNMYGFYDNYHPERSHYVAALIRKIFYAKDSIELFGTGAPLRQFMYAGDFAFILSEIVRRDITESFNVATPEVKTIKEIAEIAIKATGKELTIAFNKSYPDGQYRKDVAIDKFNEFFRKYQFASLEMGIKETYDYYSDHINKNMNRSQPKQD
jgi:GDP-L-fucose synthase